MEKQQQARSQIRQGDKLLDDLDDEGAMAAYDRAADILAGDDVTASSPLVARAYRSGGAAAFNLGREAEGIRRFELAREIYIRGGDEIMGAAVDSKLVQALGAVDRHDAAITVGLRALEVFARHGENHRLSEVHYWVGMNSASLGRTDAARSHCDAGLANSDSTAARKNFYRLSGGIYAELGDLPEAEGEYVKALAEADRLQDDRAVHGCANALANVQFAQQKYSDARLSWELAADAAVRRGDLIREADSLMNVACALSWAKSVDERFSQDDNDHMLQCVRRAVSLCQQAGNEGKAQEYEEHLDQFLEHHAPTEKPAPAAASAQPQRSSARNATSNPEVQALLDELDSMIGLDPVKKQVRTLVARCVMNGQRRALHMEKQRLTEHMVFKGPPGTGKTTVARLVGKIYRALGALPSEVFVEVDRSHLVGEYLGHTAVKTNRAIDEAIGGILFIDEAYSLAGSGYSQGDAFGEEAVSTLLKRMEDSREDFVVVAAGYTDLMIRFLRSNAGLASRFTATITFPSYSANELVKISERVAAVSGDALIPDALPLLSAFFQDVIARGAVDELGNGRLARNIVEKAAQARDLRVFDSGDAPTQSVLSRLETADVRTAVLGLRHAQDWIA